MNTLKIQADDDEVVATAVPVTNDVADDDVPSSKEELEQRKLLLQKEPAFAFLGFASFMMLVQASHDCDTDGVDCEGDRAFAVSISVFALVAVGLHFAFDLAEYFKFCGRVAFWDSYVEPFLTISLWVLWGIGAFVLTFKAHDDNNSSSAPWSAVGTGWLMTWAGVLTTTALLYPEFSPAWKGLQEKFPFLKNVGITKGHSFVYALGLLIASFVCFVEATDLCDETDCEGNNGWAFTVSLTSFIYGIIIFTCGSCLDNSCPIILKIASAGLPIWWFVGISVICVEGPFTGVANGFFGAYAGFTFSVLICLEYFGMIGDKKENE